MVVALASAAAIATASRPIATRNRKGDSIVEQLRDRRHATVRIAIIAADALGLDGLSAVLSLSWLGLCAYTWVAPGMFRRMVARSLDSVQLDPDF